ncbi:MAG: FAD-dependent monooxygenase [Elusimicrobia bacterium]|nr:FAD-dependent monooxygenase [Elusimicrobiota bacterium]
MPETKERVAVVGAGLAGAVAAVYLGQSGREVDLFEKRLDPRKAPAERGRSINLALSERGLYALGEIGLKDKVLAQAIPMRGRMIHSRSGALSFQPYGTESWQVIHSVSRAGLNQAAVEAAESLPNVRVHFGMRAVDADLDAPAVEFESVEGGARRRAEADFLVGADGAFSALRARMQRLDRFDYRQDYLEHGYKELTIPALAGGGWALEKNALHIWPRGYFMMIALPNSDGSFTVTLFWPWEGPNSFSALKTEGDVLSFFESTFPDAVPLMPTLATDFMRNPSSSLVTIRCFPWRYKDKAVLLGDAAHAVVPFYGQGMNAAFEDCSVLLECLKKDAGERRAAFKRFETSRKKQTETLAELALENFVEMRDHTASRAFLIKKQVEKALHRLFPGWYIPLYTMVTFTRMPYADAARRARLQDRAVGAFALLVGAVVLMMAWFASK